MTSSCSLQLASALAEDDIDLEEYLAPSGDFWIDCDYMFRPDGEMIDFCVVSGSGSQVDPTPSEMAVVHDSVELDKDDKTILIRFMESLERTGVHNALRCSRLPLCVPKYISTVKEYAQNNGCYVIAFRGGVGYAYVLYEMRLS